MSKSWKTGNAIRMSARQINRLQKIKERMTQLTGRERTPMPLEDIVGSMNASLRGWVNYFHYREFQ